MYFLIKTDFFGLLKTIAVQNQLPISLDKALMCNNILKGKNSSFAQTNLWPLISYYTLKTKLKDTIFVNNKDLIQIFQTSFYTTK